MPDLAPPAAAPLWPRVVALIGLFWGGYGLYLTPRVFEAARMGAIAPWVALCYAIDVFAAILGSLCLLSRPRWAIPLLATALLGDLVWAIDAGGTVQVRVALASALIVLLLLLAAFAARRNMRRF